VQTQSRVHDGIWKSAAHCNNCQRGKKYDTLSFINVYRLRVYVYLQRDRKCVLSGSHVCALHDGWPADISKCTTNDTEALSE